MDSERKEQPQTPPRPIVHPRIHEHHDVVRCDIIGDVHGCCDELEILLRRLGHEALLDPQLPRAPAGSVPEVVFVGDIVDRGDRITDALRLVHRLCRRGYALSVIGNHDDRFLRYLLGKNIRGGFGLEDTIEEFEALPEKEREQWRKELIEFLGNLPWALRIDHGRAIVAHAAWHADLADESSSGKVRSYTMYGPVTGDQRPEGYPERIDWAPDYHGPEYVVFGHQVYDAPYHQPHAVGIDTGCVFGGALTALRYPGRETVSVPSLRARVRR